MNAPKFTPGQWTITSCDKNNSIAIVMGNVNGRRTPIVEIKALPCIGGHDDVAAQRACDQEHANAHVVLALPELYAALKDLEVCANTVDRCYSHNPGGFAAALRDLKDSAKAARAALAKAVA